MSMFVQESSSQLPLEDLDKLLELLKCGGLVARHPRLVTLLGKLRLRVMASDDGGGGGGEFSATEKTHPLAITSSAVADIKINKVRTLFL